MIGANLLLHKPSVSESNLLFNETISVFSLPEEDSKAYRFRLHKRYDSYPLHTFKLPNGSALLEGLVYNKSLPEIEFQVQELFNKANPGTELLQNITSNWTGEWCLWIQSGDNLFIVNDRMGRLPMYFHNTGTHFFAGRHLGLLAENKLLTPDKMSTASLLWSGYLIGHRTPFKDVHRLPGGSVIKVGLNKATVDIQKGSQLNFDQRSDASLQKQATELAALYGQACSRIADKWPGTINISQSGGQDSRAVAVGFKNAVKDNRLIASSFVMPGAERDAALGKSIADALHLPFSAYPVKSQPALEQELLAHKFGMNYVAMSFILDFYKQMLKDNSGFMYVTGDGGDKALPYLGEKNLNLSLDQLILQLSRRHATTPVEKVAAITGTSKDEILQMIYNTVSSYPEQNMNNRSIHFTIYERAVQCFFEGEDRSRYFAWATTPFYDLDFFNAAMLVPDNYKKHYRIYRPFQNELSREIANIPDASGYSINNWKFIARKRVQELFRSAPPGVKDIVRKLGGVAISVNKGTKDEHQFLIQQLKDYKALENIMDADAVGSFLEIANEEQYQYLRTLILTGQLLNQYR